jgi:hypothetical protein
MPQKRGEWMHGGARGKFLVAPNELPPFFLGSLVTANQ